MLLLLGSVVWYTHIVREVLGSFGWLITNTVCNNVCISIVFML